MEVVLCAGWAHMIYSAYITKNLSLYVKIIIYVCALHILKLINGDARCTLNANFFFSKQHLSKACARHLAKYVIGHWVSLSPAVHTWCVSVGDVTDRKNRNLLLFINIAIQESIYYWLLLKYWERNFMTTTFVFYKIFCFEEVYLEI